MHYPTFFKKKKYPGGNTIVTTQPRSDSVANCPTRLPHYPSGTSSERRSPKRKPRLGLAGFEPATSDEGKRKSYE
jgi:hypothetical protein